MKLFLVALPIIALFFTGCATNSATSLISLNDTLWQGSIANKTVGLRSTGTLAIDNFNSANGNIEGVMIVDAPLLGSGKFSGSYDNKNGILQGMLIPDSGKGTMINFEGNVKNNVYSGRYSLGAYRQLKAQSGSFSLSLKQTGQNHINLVKSYLPKRVKEEIATWNKSKPTTRPKPSQGSTNRRAINAPVSTVSRSYGNSGVVESQLDGDFEEMDEGAIFKLMNGQIWQQSSYHYEYSYGFMKKVLIYPSNGQMKIKVDGFNGSPSVVRIR